MEEDVRLVEVGGADERNGEGVIWDYKVSFPWDLEVGSEGGSGEDRKLRE